MKQQYESKIKYDCIIFSPKTDNDVERGLEIAVENGFKWYSENTEILYKSLSKCKHIILELEDKKITVADDIEEGGNTDTFMKGFYDTLNYFIVDDINTLDKNIKEEKPVFKNVYSKK